MQRKGWCCLQEAPYAESDVVGFHGTSKSKAATIVFNQEFKSSEHDYDWLGHGIYFWPGSLDHGMRWAVDRHGSDSAVVQATIHYGRCLDLSKTEYVPLLKTSRKELEEDYKRRGLPLPANNGKEHYLDCAVVEWLLTRHVEADTVVGVFREGTDLFPGSMFQDLSHIQIAVRNPRNLAGRFEKVWEARTP